jgi:PTS system galactitol-specific IIB component
MAKKKLTILAVCGSGVVSSSMIGQKVEDALKEVGLRAEVIGILATSVESYVKNGNIDMVVTTSPVQGEINVPVIKAVALLTGFGEEEVLEEIKETAKKVASE